jgi:hypothetical protein
MLWNDAQHVLAPRINRLDSVSFVNLCNHLLSEIAAKNGISRGCLVTTLRTTEPDGGIDARCVDAPNIAGQFIPQANIIYQYKSGNENKSAGNIVQKDILEKPRVLEAIEQDKILVYIAGWDRSNKFSDDVIAEAKKKGLDLTDKFIFLGSNIIAHQLATFPALASNLLHINLDGAIGIEEWSRQPNVSNPFQTDAHLTSQINDLRSQIEAPGSRIRVVGSAGDGKTRRILEVLKTSFLRNSVLYAAQVQYLSHSFINHLSTLPDVECTIVVDEVNDRDAESLSQQFNNMPPGIRLIMIGLDASGRAIPGTFQVEGLSIDLLTQAILSIVPGLAPDQARSIAGECEGSPKLAIVIARRIEEDPTLTSNRQLLADGPVQSALDRYLGIEESSDEWHALSIVALLARLGWSGPMNFESEQLFQGAGTDPVRSRGWVDSLHSRMGIAPKAGNYRYVSPTMLANHLASRQLRRWTRGTLTDLFEALTAEMQESFAIRIRRMSHVLGDNQHVVEEVILSDRGPFRTLADLEGSPASSLIRHLAAPFPGAALNALERIIGNATLDELRNAKNSRRNCVWSLEVLLWPATTFNRAASLLLKLALSENETYGNNASHIWTSTFQTQLGRTSAGLVSRAKVLREAANRPEAEARKLAAAALQSAVNIEHFHRDGIPPNEFATMPEEAWSPETWGEWSEAFVKYLQILTPLLDDSDSSVHYQAVTTLGSALQAAIRLPVSSRIQQSPLDTWFSLAELYIGKSYEDREIIIESIELQIQIWEAHLAQDEGSSLSESDRNRWEVLLDRLRSLNNELRGTDFTSRFRGTLIRPIHQWANDEFAEAEIHRGFKIQELVTEILDEPDLMKEQMSWMLSITQDRQWFFWKFFETLGRSDQHRIFSENLRDIASSSPNAIMWHSLYQLGWSSVFGLNDSLDGYLLHLTETNVSIEIIFDLLVRAGYTPSRMQLVNSLIQQKKLAPDAVGSLAYHPWGDNIPIESMCSLLDNILALADSTTFVRSKPLTQLLHNYLKQNDFAKEPLQDLVIKILSLPGDENVTNDWDWTGLALIYVREEPVILTQAALEFIGQANIYNGGRFREFVEVAWQSADKKLLFEEAIAPAISLSKHGKYSEGFWLRHQALKNFPLEEAGVEFLMDWVRGQPEERAVALADIIGAPGNTVSDLHAALLAEYGEEGVGATFDSALNSGSWIGDMSDWLLAKIKLAEGWTNDKRPPVHMWANEILKSLRKAYKSELDREAEEVQFRKLLY